MIYTLTLSPALDYVVHVDNLSCDDINRSKSEEIYFGGKGINVSVILSRLGHENKALGFIGGFTGDKLEELLKNEGISSDFTRIEKGETRINVKIRTDKEIDINAGGPQITENDINSLFEKLENVENGDYLVIAGSVPKTLPCDIYEKIMKHLSEKEINFIVDTSGKLLLSTLRFRPFLIKPNHHELGEIFGIKAESDEEIINCAEEMQKLGARNILVSRAEKGALLLDENGEIHKSQNADGTLINSVGCGDSMVAGFLAGYLEKQDYEYSLRLGTACGNATAYSKGLGKREEIERMMRI